VVTVSVFTLADIKERKVKCIDSSLPPPEKVHLALDCLPVSVSSQETLDGTDFSFCRWTIMDYAKAYRSGDITPSLVFSSFYILEFYYLLLSCFQFLLLVSGLILNFDRLKSLNFFVFVTFSFSLSSNSVNG